MTKTDWQLAGWAAVINAALTIPLFVLQLATDLAGYSFLSKMIQIVTMLLFVFIFFRLKRLLLEHGFNQADSYLSAVIAITAFLGVATVFAPKHEGFLAVLLMAGVVVLGVLYIVLGIKLLTFPVAVSGMKLLSYSTIATGVCAASFLLIPLALVGSIVMYVALAIAFFSDVGESTLSYGAAGDDRIEPRF